MFNFKVLKLVRPEEDDSLSSFVGIRRNHSGDLEFRLPHGFSEFPVNDFEQVKRLFFRLYRTFKKFEYNSTLDILDQRPVNKDNIVKQNNGYRFKDKEDNEVILYSKIALIENLLEVYHDLALDVIERRIGKDERIDYSKIEHYLHLAIYLDKHAIFIDEMNLPRQTLQYKATTLIGLFCFILAELQTELEQETDARVKELSHCFSEKHLNNSQSLFNEETFEITIKTLKDILDDVDKHTAYKDDDYWRLYESIELFLYGELNMQNTHEDGIFWGISNFYQIWEDMCNTYAFANFNVVYADTNIILDGKSVANDRTTGCAIFKKTDFENPFFVEFRSKRRWIYPDCVHFDGKNITLFGELIKINERECGNGRMNFEIHLIDKKSKLAKDAYDDFCKKLKNQLNNRIHGARVESGNIFKNYPKDLFQKIKKLIELTFKINNPILYTILDWKYMAILCFFNPLSKKVNQDLIKQLCYELALKQQSPSCPIKNQFVIPYFYENKKDEGIGDISKNKNICNKIIENGIEIFQANFSKLQEVYLNHD